VIRFFSGHALGNLTVLPIALLLTGRSARKDTRRLLMRKRLDALIVLPLTIAVDTIVFVQSSWPILFLPVMFVVLATFRLGRTGAALSLAALALIGGALTCLGYGPINLLHASAAERILFFQWYLACTVLTIVPVAAELHRRATLLRRVRDSEARFRMLAEHSSDIILHLGRRGEFRFVSPAITRLSGHDPATLIGRRSGEFVHPDDHRLVWSEHRLCFEVPGTTRRYRHRAVLADGSLRWVEAHACAVLDEDGRPDGVISLLRDITESRQEQEQWRSAAMTDRLTGLPNRRSLELAVSRLNGGDHCLALLDLDRFKQVNDTYGHDAGDAVLTGFAEVAQRLVRTHDMVARLGGEEFVILFEHTQIDQAYQVCDRLRRILAQTPLVTPAGPLRITVSGGVAPIGRGGLEAGLKAADEALYRAKRGGRDQLLLAA
jgi:diguanylate cyclase (GGDEF)-like protein/PAS domain S-box-containing protein